MRELRWCAKGDRVLEALRTPERRVPWSDLLHLCGVSSEGQLHQSDSAASSLSVIPFDCATPHRRQTAGHFESPPGRLLSPTRNNGIAGAERQVRKDVMARHDARQTGLMLIRLDRGISCRQQACYVGIPLPRSWLRGCPGALVRAGGPWSRDSRCGSSRRA